MILTIIQNSWDLFLIFVFIFLPIVFVFGLVKAIKEPALATITEEEITSMTTEPVQERITPEIYRTVKKEPGSYEVRGPNNSIAIVIKVEYPNEGTYWVASHAAKNGKTADRVKTKKEAVEAAIDLLKDANNGK